MQVFSLLGSNRLFGIHLLIGKMPNNFEYTTVKNVFSLAYLLHFPQNNVLDSVDFVFLSVKVQNVAEVSFSFTRCYISLCLRL